MNDNGVCLFCEVLEKSNTSQPIQATRDALIYLKDFRNKKQEHLICLSLDSSNRLLKRRVVTLGLLDITLIHPREIYAEPIAERAASVILVHNHPSGNPMPSKHDIEMTQQIYSAGILLGIPLKDHIIISKKKHFSFKEEGMI